MPSYPNACIYKICCKDPEIQDIYLGGSANMKNTIEEHIHQFNYCGAKNHNLCVYKFIRENGGLSNWKIVQIKKVKDCRDKRQIHNKLVKYIKKLKPSLNIQSDIEYHEEKKQTYKEYRMHYRERHKEQTRKSDANYYKCNKDKINERNQQYYKKNKDKISKKRKEKVQCQCGVFVSRHGLQKHKKSKKHRLLMKNRFTRNNVVVSQIDRV